MLFDRERNNHEETTPSPRTAPPARHDRGAEAPTGSLTQFGAGDGMRADTAAQVMSHWTEQGASEPASYAASHSRQRTSNDNDARHKGPGADNVPDLKVETVESIKKLIKDDKRQEALDKLVAEAAAAGKIDKTLLDGGKAHYDASISGEGVVDPPGYQASGKAEKSKVLIGTDAFGKGVPWLYSSVMHEYWHVRQFQQNKDSPSKVPGQGSDRSLINQQEVEAYCWEIMNAEKHTGMDKHPDQVKEAWLRLYNNYWVALTKDQRTPLLDKATNAHKIAEKITGEKLTFVA